MVLAPLAVYVPLTVLAAILFVVAFNMSQAGRLVRVARRAPRSDVGIMLITLGLCVFSDVSVAVEVGVILALLNFFRRMTSAVEVRSMSADDLGARLPAEQALTVPEGILVFTVDGPFFFGAVEEFESALTQTDTDPGAVVFKLIDVPFIDLTGLLALKDAVEELEKRGIEVALCCASPGVEATLAKAHVSGTVPSPSTATLSEAVAAVTERMPA